MTEPLFSTKSKNKETPLDAAKKAADIIGEIKPGNTHQIGTQLQKMIIHYYEDVRRQAQQSFICALIAAGIGIIFFIFAIAFKYHSKAIDGELSLIAGSLIQIISAINFFLYGKTARQFSSFHICLERTNRYIIANSICDNIENIEKKDAARHELIIKMAVAPLLTLDMVTKGKAYHSENSSS